MNSKGLKGIRWAIEKQIIDKKLKAIAKVIKVTVKCFSNQRLVKNKKVPLAPIPKRAILIII